MNPAGFMTLPFTLTLDTTGVSTSDGTADVETEIVDFTVPKGMSVSFRQGDVWYLVVADSGNAQITSGTARLKVADANKIMKVTVAEAPLANLDAGGTPEDKEKQYNIRSGFFRTPDQHILITIDSSTAVDISQALNALNLSGVQTVQV